MDGSHALTSVVAFCVALFFYVHLRYHHKKSDDAEVYYVDYPSKDKLNEICELRQPVVFGSARVGDVLARFGSDEVKRAYRDYDVHVREGAEGAEGAEGREGEKYMPARLANAAAVLTGSTPSGYFSERNGAFLEETGLAKQLKRSEYLLRPSLVLFANYDVILGPMGEHTPFRYRLDYRTYYAVASGRVRIRMASPNNARYMEVDDDYEYMEFRARIDAWSTEDTRLKFIDVDLTRGQILYVPAYWFHSIRFEESGTSVVSFHYRTCMSYLSTAPENALHHMQRQNVRYVGPTGRGNILADPSHAPPAAVQPGNVSPHAPQSPTSIVDITSPRVLEEESSEIPSHTVEPDI